MRLSKLGLFKFAEKNAMKEAIAQAEAEIAAADYVCLASAVHRPDRWRSSPIDHPCTAESAA